MVNQDLVAARLARKPIMEMHALLWDRGMNTQCTWFEFSSLNETREFLLFHGWTLEEYSKECVRDFVILTKYYYMIRWFNRV